ncbi:acyl transferase domain-containing protein [Pedobacter psychrotolerans]|uniref:Acyl transferase domain-containing protein n=1 Tax=Pedobacter psychrotolerans TaxID=1843235 RepID=A0A4R2H0C7_9SPHI|nr:type I polyketide synthase [Pedobacter psychrotolerans]TCO17547.1 acyl transferase domain-containing protein [Pedobacter psychrotolerans]GGE71298.1 hypothetical protein GCM10011413_42600 [Pedobacter psychrotolerans]
MKSEKKYGGLEIAIIGISSCFPKSVDYRKFWQNLINGEDLITKYSDEELINSGVPKSILENNTYVKTFGEVENKNRFDYGFFGYTPEEAALMDPQIRLFHEYCWAALEDAGYSSSIEENVIGLFAGASLNDNWRLYTSGNANETSVDSFFLNQISTNQFISSLVSYKLNLRGPSYFIDTACSTSLVAVHLACRSLLMKECKIALAGGATINTLKKKGFIHKDGMVASKDGYCRSFDNAASGTVFGEGVGVVVLKRLADAMNDGDNIYAIIKSSAVNNDGSQKSSYTAPSVQGQIECISSAQRLAHIDAHDIGYIEAHGTATKLGDPIEILALNKAFGVGGEKKFCAVGSVKSNMGHLDVVAGVAGLIKAALCLKNKQIPATLHFKRPNSEIDFNGGPFYVNNHLKEWKIEDGSTRYAGVNSLGIGGTNAHVILEEACDIEEDSSRKEYLLLNISGKTKNSVKRYIDKLRLFLIENPNTNLEDMSYTLQTGRKNFLYRRAFVYKDLQGLLETLAQAELDEKIVKNMNTNRPLVFMFPGAGSQYVNMGRDLYLADPVFMQEMNRGFDLLKTLTNFNYFEIFYPKKDDDFTINKMLHTQPVVFLFEYALTRMMITYGFVPKYMIGHSIGEYVAACISGVFTFEDAMKLVIKRGELIDSLPEGRMISAIIDEESAKKYLNGVCLAAVNGDDQIVFSGSTQSIELLTKELDKDSVSWIKLHANCAGHSEMMNPILGPFKDAFSDIRLNPPRIPFVSCLTGAFITDEECLSPEYWVKHMRETVQFSKGIRSISSYDKRSLFIEIGSSNSLSTLLRQRKMDDVYYKPFNLVRHPKEDINDLQHLLERFGQLWTQSIDVNWKAYYQLEKRKKISLPTYCFEPFVFPTEVDPFLHYPVAITTDDEPSIEKEDINRDLYESYKVERPDLSSNFVAAVTDTEIKVKVIFEDFFCIKEIGIEDNFFELGGDSLRAMILLKRINNNFNLSLTVKDFFQKSDIKSVASFIDEVTWLKNEVEMDNEINI